MSIEHVQGPEIRDWVERCTRQNSPQEPGLIIVAFESLEGQCLVGPVGCHPIDSIELLDTVGVESPFGIDCKPRAVGPEDDASRFPRSRDIPDAQRMIPARRRDEAGLAQEGGPRHRDEG
jgi:hypothetical protein